MRDGDVADGDANGDGSGEADDDASDTDGGDSGDASVAAGTRGGTAPETAHAMTRDTERTTDGASTPEPVTRRTVLQSAAAGVAGIGGAAGGATATVSAQSDDGATNAVAFDFSYLPDLPDDVHYAALAINDVGPVALGTFQPRDEYVVEVEFDLREFEALEVAITPEEELTTETVVVPVLRGELEDREASLSFSVDFADPPGTFLLNTPTAPDVDGESGLWFLEPRSEPLPTLDLPELPAGWTYEAWVHTQRTWISLGRFDDPTEADGDATYAGDEAEPPAFPGGDLLQDAPGDLEFPTDLTEYASEVVVSVEPEVEGVEVPGGGPFPITPLRGEIPLDGEARTVYDMELHPHGQQEIEISRESGGTWTGGFYLDVERDTLPALEGGEYHAWYSYEGEEWEHAGMVDEESENWFGRDDTDQDYFALTIEPEGFEPPAEPTSIDAAIVEDTTGTVRLEPHRFDFSDASGAYALATPTDGADSTETSGVWFLDPNPQHVPSLDLPALDDEPHWTYEGWVWIHGEPVSIGRFDDPAAADDAAPYSGDAEAPPYPGEDFVTNAPEPFEFPIDLTDGDSRVTLSVEPVLDGEELTEPGPFGVQPFRSEIPADAEPGEPQPLSMPREPLPDGRARLYESAEAARLLGDEVGDQVAHDLDGDGLHSDVNGDGAVGPRDVGTFFQNFHLDAWDREEFDFSGNGRVSHGDVVTLFDDVTN